MIPRILVDEFLLIRPVKLDLTLLSLIPAAGQLDSARAREGQGCQFRVRHYAADELKNHGRD
jgi:hypothetical protein